MATRRILELPHPALRQRAKKVRRIGPSVLRLAYDMIDTMREAKGVGLAANQVGVLRRVIVIQLVEDDEASIYINPEITHREGSREVEEGCLSIPGYKGFITRSVWIRFAAMDHAWKTIKLRAEDLLAQALEHEVDHLNGILYVDHLEDHEALIKVESEAGSGEAGAPMTTVQSAQLTSHDDTFGPAPATSADTASRETPASLKVR